MLKYTEEYGIQWFGLGVDHLAAKTCLEVLDRAVLDTFGVPLYRTPGLTGLMAWQRRWGHEYRPLPIELQNLIRSTTTQGRFECCPVPQRVEFTAEQNRVDWLPALVCLDMRWAYAAAAQTIVGGKGWRHEERPAGGWPGCPDGDDRIIGGWRGYKPARYRVQFQAPEEWRHVGLLPYRNGASWDWPIYPDTTVGWSTWADHTEVRLAIECGWQVEILERLICVDEVRYYDRPLLRWCEAMLRLRGQLEQEAQEKQHADLFAAAVRAMILQAIGLMAAGPRTVTARTESRDDLPGHDLAEESYYEDPETGEIVYRDYARSGITRMLHPEIAAAVWGQTRTWLLKKLQRIGEQVTVTGVLDLPREQVVGFGLDALYLTADPGWPDDGREGRWRVKWRKEGPLPAPKHRGELEAPDG